MRTSKTIIVVYSIGALINCNLIRAYKERQNMLRKEVDAMRCLRILLISGLLALVFGVVSCCSSRAPDGDKLVVKAERVAWRPTGTGFYHPEIGH